MKRVLIYGAGGFSGRRLARYLRERGIEVFTISGTLGPVPGNYKVRISDIQAVMPVLREVKPEGIVLMSGQMPGAIRGEDSVEMYRVNALAPTALIEATEKTGLASCPILLMGTAAEYGKVNPGDLPITEETAPRPYNHYGVSKLAGTHAGVIAARNGRPIIMTRPFNMIGPDANEHLVLQDFAKQIVLAAKGKGPRVVEVGNIEASRDFIDVDDVAPIFWSLLRAPRAYGQIINICSGTPVRIRDALNRLIELSGIEIEIRQNPDRMKPIDIPVHYGSNAKLRQVLAETDPSAKFSLIPFDESLKKLYTHLLKEL